MITSIFLYLLLLFLKFRGHNIYIMYIKVKSLQEAKKKKSQQDYF